MRAERATMTTIERGKQRIDVIASALYLLLKGHTPGNSLSSETSPEAVAETQDGSDSGENLGNGSEWHG